MIKLLSQYSPALRWKEVSPNVFRAKQGGITWLITQKEVTRSSGTGVYTIKYRRKRNVLIAMVAANKAAYAAATELLERSLAGTL